MVSTDPREGEGVLRYALAYAALGWPVLPIKPGSKMPHGLLAPSGLLDATCDASTVRRWWAIEPRAGIGLALAPAGLMAVDVDPRNGGDISALPVDPGGTLRARTGGGGEHYVFAVPDGYEPVKSAWRGIDLKWRGYIVVEPSEHPSGGTYAWDDWEVGAGAPEIRVAPLALLQRVGEQAEVASFGSEPIGEHQLAELRATLATIPSDDRDTWIAVGHSLASIKNEGVGWELWSEWSRRSDKWDERDARRVWASFANTRSHFLWVFKNAEALGGRNVMIAVAPPSEPIVARAFRLRDPSTIEPRDWLYKRILIRKYVTGTFAPGAAAKTQITLMDLVSVSCGFDLATRAPLPRGPLRCWYINVEDDMEEIERRLGAICKLYNVTDADLGGRLFIDTDREGRYVVAETAKAGVVVREAVVGALTDQVLENRIDVFVVDPLVGAHAVSENSNPEMNRVMAQLRRVAEQGNCGAHVIHHVRKGTDEVTAEDGRGASAVKDACRAIRTLTPMSEKEAQEYGIAPDRRRFYVWANPSGKPNLAPPAESREWYYLTEVGLGNGRERREEDKIGVPTPWSPPSPFDGMSLNDCRRIWARIGREPLAKCRESSQAGDWVGYLVMEEMGWPAEDAALLAKTKGVVSAWLASGALVVQTLQNSKGRALPCVRPGPGSTLT